MSRGIKDKGTSIDGDVKLNVGQTQGSEDVVLNSQREGEVVVFAQKSDPVQEALDASTKRVSTDFYAFFTEHKDAKGKCPTAAGHVSRNIFQRNTTLHPCAGAVVCTLDVACSGE